MRSIRADLPPDLERIVRRCLAKEPAERIPSARDLLEELRRLQQTVEPFEIARRQDPEASIAVLPFANMSADPENEYFSDGLSEELLNVLAKIPDLKVTGRTSSFAFKGKNEDLRDIGQKLGFGRCSRGASARRGIESGSRRSSSRRRTAFISGPRPTIASSTTSSPCRTTSRARCRRRCT